MALRAMVLGTLDIVLPGLGSHRTIFPEEERNVDDLKRSWLGRRCPPGGSWEGLGFCTPSLWAV